MSGDAKAARPDLAELFSILRQLRLRAGLTLKQVAEATGAGGRHGNRLISRLETGHVANPSLRLVLDHLRACGAGPEDVREFLNRYLGAKLPVPARPLRGPRVTKPKPEDAETLALRKEAAWWNLRRVVEHMLHHELDGLQMKSSSKERRALANFSRKVFRILYQTRRLRPALRERRLERCRTWAALKGLPADALSYLYRAVSALFEDLERNDELDWLPDADAARQLMYLPQRDRIETDEQLCRDRAYAKMGKELRAQEAARNPIIEAALNLLKSEGIHGGDIGNYRFFISTFLLAAEVTAPGTPERAQHIEDAMHRFERPSISQPLLRRLAELVTTLRDQGR